MTTKIHETVSGLGERLSVLETKQDQSHEQILNLDKSMRSRVDRLDEKIEKVETDLHTCQKTGFNSKRGEHDERFTWLFRVQALAITLILSTLGLILWHLGFPIPLP